MSELKFNKAADEEHEVKLDSHLISVSWRSGLAYAGYKAGFEVRTVFVGNGAKIKVTGKSEKGKKLGKVKGKINNNVFIGEFDVPEKIDLDDELSFEAELSQNSLSGESNKIPVYPAPKIKSIKWSAEEARRGDTLTLSAELEDVNDNTEVKLIIYEHDADGAHDKITELTGMVKESKIEENWDYEYHEDTDELPTKEEIKQYGGSYNPPEYFFTIKVGDFELGKENQDSGILNFKDWFEYKLEDDNGNPVVDEEYKATLPDGQEKKGKTDSDGMIIIEDIPPGKVELEFPSEEEEEEEEEKEEEEKDAEEQEIPEDSQQETQTEPGDDVEAKVEDEKEVDREDEDEEDEELTQAMEETGDTSSTQREHGGGSTQSGETGGSSESDETGSSTQQDDSTQESTQSDETGSSTQQDDSTQTSTQSGA